VPLRSVEDLDVTSTVSAALESYARRS